MSIIQAISIFFTFYTCTLAFFSYNVRLSLLNSEKYYAGIAQLVEHNLAKVGVASSSLVSRSNISTNQYHILRGNSSVGRAQPCQGWGREFEPRFPLQIFLSNLK
ncbi:unknown [Pasteurella multocida subsp. multocida str. Pm70]|nr:RecName: Full=Uncharacterized protein PM0901 [Pasteurella multocida subsp. multocida str. Pm70]AAK02985.1 unknown [Pasteurella multocida subsp. multocida str. Pm70]